MATYDTSYYDKAYEEFEKKQKQSTQDQKTQTEADYNNRLKQAYIANRQTQKATEEALSQAGIRGGMTETSALKNALAYQNARTGLQTERASAIREIDRNADNNIFAYKQTNDAAKNAYVEGREAEDREVTRQATAEQKEANIQLLTTTYGGYTDVSKLKTKLKSVTDPTEQAIIQARINFLNEENTNKQNAENTAYWESKYGGYTSVSSLNKALKNAKTTIEKTIIQNRINELNEENTNKTNAANLSYWESKYGGYTSTSSLKTALKNAKTTEEKTIIQNRINELNDASASTKYDRYTAYYSRYYNTDDLKKIYKNTTDPVIKQVINERLGYLKAQKKGY